LAVAIRAINVALALLDLQGDIRGTKVLWAIRRDRTARLLGGGLNDQLPGRGALGLAAKHAIDEGRLNILAPFLVDSVDWSASSLCVKATFGGRPIIEEVDRIVVATGFRPDFSFLRELRLGLDPVVEATPALAPLIDPNVHSCGTVQPHGIDELTHPEPGFVIVGSKSYGRAPTFLMATGYEQVRSVVADIAGDHSTARQVHLILPETGVCGAAHTIAANSCCGSRPRPRPPPAAPRMPSLRQMAGTNVAAPHLRSKLTSRRTPAARAHRDGFDTTRHAALVH
jgi:hypothetical protein